MASVVPQLDGEVNAIEPQKQNKLHTGEVSFLRGTKWPSLAAVERSTWEQQEADPRFFTHLRLAKDGGLSQVRTLFTTSRCAWAMVSVLFLVMNFYVLVVDSITRLSKADAWIVNTQQKESKALIINGICYGLFGWELRPDVLLAILELVMFTCFILFQLVLCIGHIAFSSAHSDRWHAVVHLFWEILPEMLSLSAVRLLHFVTPSILIPRFDAQVVNSIERHGGKCGLPLIRFVLLRIMAAIIGYDAFVVKFFEAVQNTNGSETRLRAILSSAAFLNQMLGIVQVARFGQRRLFVYLFGGQDGVMGDSEELKLRTWLAMLAQRIWQISQSHKVPFGWFCAVMLTYSDQDFQTLTLNSSAETKDEN